MLAKNKTVWVLRPQSRKTYCRLGTNPPPQKGTFWRAVPIQKYCLLWGRMARMALLPMVRAHLLTYKAQGSNFLDLLYTCVIVVHSYLQLWLIGHEWGASFFDVGASLKNCSHRLQRIKPYGSFSSKADNGKGMPPHVQSTR